MGVAVAMGAMVATGAIVAMGVTLTAGTVVLVVTVATEAAETGMGAIATGAVVTVRGAGVADEGVDAEIVAESGTVACMEGTCWSKDEYGGGGVMRGGGGREGGDGGCVRTAEEECPGIGAMESCPSSVGVALPSDCPGGGAPSS